MMPAKAVVLLLPPAVSNPLPKVTLAPTVPVREPIVSTLGQVPAEVWMSAAGAAGLIATAAHPTVRKGAVDLGRRLIGRGNSATTAALNREASGAKGLALQCVDVFAK